MSRHLGHEMCVQVDVRARRATDRERSTVHAVERHEVVRLVAPLARSFALLAADRWSEGADRFGRLGGRSGSEDPVALNVDLDTRQP